jgi:hypothetical protein
MSDDQNSCGLVQKDVKLSDEQVDLLNQHPEVILARRAYLSRLLEGLKAQDQAIIDEARSALRLRYEEAFRARLVWVLENPPAPKSPPDSGHKGFAKRA